MERNFTFKCNRVCAREAAFFREFSTRDYVIQKIIIAKLQKKKRKNRLQCNGLALHMHLESIHSVLFEYFIEFNVLLFDTF